MARMFDQDGLYRGSTVDGLPPGGYVHESGVAFCILSVHYVNGLHETQYLVKEVDVQLPSARFSVMASLEGGNTQSTIPNVIRELEKITPWEM